MSKKMASQIFVLTLHLLILAHIILVQAVSPAESFGEPSGLAAGSGLFANSKPIVKAHAPAPGHLGGLKLVPPPPPPSPPSEHEDCDCENPEDQPFARVSSAECQLQVECTGKILTNSANGGHAAKKIRIPVRAAQGPQGPRGPKGPQGPRGPPGHSPIISDTTIARVLTGSSVVRQIMHQTESHRPRIAFFAGLQLNIDSMPPEQRVVMNNTITNVGNAYDPERGEFCATVDGVYALIVAISAQGQKQAAVRLMHNDKHIFDVWCESSPWSTATNQALLLMRRGDCAWLQVRESAIYLHGYMYSTFAGYMLFEHPLV